jgi:hypothetical protein
MDDQAGSSMLKRAGDRARHTLTVKRVAQLLQDAGVPRSARRIKYFCQNGSLDAGYLPSPTGDQWYINPASVPGRVGELRQFDEQLRRREHAAAGSGSHSTPHNTNSAGAGNSMQQHAAASHDTPEPSPNNNFAASGSSTLQPAAKHDNREEDRPPAAYVEQLQKRIDEKDEIIVFLREELKELNDEIARRNDREKETNILIRGLQNLVLRLQPRTPPNADVLANDPLIQPTEQAQHQAS